MDVIFWTWWEWVLYPTLFGLGIWIIFYLLHQWIDLLERLNVDPQTIQGKIFLYFISCYLVGLIATWFYWLSST